MYFLFVVLFFIERSVVSNHPRKDSNLSSIATLFKKF